MTLSGDLRSNHRTIWLRRMAAALLATTMVPAVALTADRSSAATGPPLVVVGTDVVTANLRTATYETTIRNEGSGEATNVWVSMLVPDQTTFESSDPPSSATEGSPPGAPPTCDNGGTTEPDGTKCEWFAGTLSPGEERSLRVVLNLLPLTSTNTTSTITVPVEVTGTDPSTGAEFDPLPKDTDSALKRRTIENASTAEDTFVNRAEPANTNHGECPVLTTKGDGSTTAYYDLLGGTGNPFPSDLDRLLDAEFQMNVVAGDYTQASPGSLALHAVTSGDWDEGENTNCGVGGTPGTGNQVRTGFEPAVATAATASALVTGPGAVKWNVTQNINGVAKRTAFQGWEIRNTSGHGSLDLSASESSDKPRLFIIYTIAETGRCIDVDPDFTVGHPSGEQRFTAVVKKSGPAGYQRQAAGSADACGGTPVAGQLVHWEIQDNEPDIYISNQSGTVVPKAGTATDAGPNTIKTATDAEGSSFVGVRLANPSGPHTGENRIAGCAATACPGGEPEPEDCSGPQQDLNVCTPGTGEEAREDDARFRWSPTAPSPSPSPTSSPSGWPSPSGSPTPAQSPTPGQSPSPSGSPSPSASTASTLSPATLEFASSTQTSGASAEVILSGVLSSDNPTCSEPGTTVEILEQGAESTAPQHLAFVGTGVGGTFEHKVSPEANTIYSARVEEHDLCAAAESEPITVLVRPVVTIKSTVEKIERGRRFWVTGTVMPEHQLSPVTLWRKIGPGKWERIRRTFLDEGSRYSFGVRYEWKRKRSVFHVRWSSQDADHVSTESPNLHISRQLCDIVGTDGPDTLIGTEASETICGLDGDDIIKGGGGDDTIFAGRGRDEVRGGAGNDVLRGNGGHDVLRGNGGADRLLGNRGSDRLHGGRGPDKLLGNKDTDELFGGAGKDHLKGGPGKDLMVGGRGKDTFDGNKRDRCQQGSRRSPRVSCS